MVWLNTRVKLQEIIILHLINDFDVNFVTIPLKMNYVLSWYK